MATPAATPSGARSLTSSSGGQQRLGSSSTGLQHRLDSAIAVISPRSSWGFAVLPDRSAPHSLLSVADNEFLIACGSNLTFYRDGEGKTPKMLMPQVPETSHATMMTLSNDSALLVVGLKEKPGAEGVGGTDADASSLSYRATLYLYDVKSQSSTMPNKPRVLQYTHTPPARGATSTPADFLDDEQHQFTCASFAGDNSLLACATNIISVGVLIFDAAKGEIIVQVPTTASVLSLSFNPKDPHKLCTLGDRSMFQLWRLASKNVHPAPIHGLTRAEQYTCLTWLEEENRIVAGTSDGFLVIVQGTEQLQQPVYAFGAPGQAGRMHSKVVSLLQRGDYVIAVSEFNFFSAFEVKRFSGSGAHPATAVLIPLGVWQLTDVDKITGMVWALKHSASALQHSFVSVVASHSALCVYDIKCNTLGTKAGLDSGTTAPGLNTAAILSGKVDLQTPVLLRTAKSDYYLTNFHHGPINSFALATRNCTFVTASTADESVRVRNFSVPNGPSQVTTYFSEFKNQIPNHVDMHPSGLFVASACEDEAVEFMVTDSTIGAVRHLPVKIPLTLSNGQPFVNTMPVSMVRYSHSGHLLAVVTGKNVRIFDMMRLRVPASDFVGAPPNVQFLMDNTAPITDVAFAADDSRIFTTAQDGSVYSWLMGETSRSGEFQSKGLAATKIAIDGDGLIVAVFDSEALSMASNQRASNTRVSIGAHSSKKGLVSARMSKPSPAQAKRRMSTIAPPALSSTATSNVAALTLPDAELTIADGASDAPQQFLMMWTNNVSINGGEMVLLESAVTSIALGLIDAPLKKRVSVLGLADGRVLVSILPFPLRVIAASNFGSTLGMGVTPHASSSAALTSPQSMLDETQCKSLQLHKDAVTCVSISLSGLWIFSAGQDGAVHMLSTSMRARDLLEVPEAVSVRENDYIVTEKEQLTSLRTRIGDSDNIITELKRDSERAIHKLTESSRETKASLETRLQREVKQRDEIILRGREDMLKSTRELGEQIKQIKLDHAREISELESFYERKLSKESLYLENMRQAYDEFVLHARMDLTDAKLQAEREKEFLAHKQSVVAQEGEKQKTAVLLYVDFVNARNKEILDAQEERQEEERSRLKGELREALKTVERSQQESRSEIAHLTIQNGKLKLAMSTKDDDLLRLQSDLGWANDRIRKLEAAVTDASHEMRKKTELSERWEFKAGETQQQISELERIRKALTSQLHALRQELGPKEEKLSEVSERLQEVDREYELSLSAISEKEKTLSQHGQHLALLQKQVKDYRSLSSRRDNSLRRAAKLLEEFKLSLEEAQFQSFKRTVPVAAVSEEDTALDADGVATVVTAGASSVPSQAHAHTKILSSNKGGRKGQVIELMTRTEGMEAALGRLTNLLGPFLKGAAVTTEVDEDAVLANEERERHMRLLHKNIKGLQSNLENTSVLVQAKVGSHLADNKILLQELNALRQQVRSLSLENQRLAAKAEMAELQKRGSETFTMPSSSKRHQPESHERERGSGYDGQIRDSESEGSMQRGSITSLSKSVDSNLIQMTTNSLRPSLSLASGQGEILSSSVSLEALNSSNFVSPAPLNDSRQSSRGGSRQASARQQAKTSRDSILSRSIADAKIDAIVKENEQLIRGNTAAGEILAYYQQQIPSPEDPGKTSSDQAKGPRKKVVAIPKVPRKAVPLSEDRFNKAVILPNLA